MFKTFAVFLHCILIDESYMVIDEYHTICLSFQHLQYFYCILIDESYMVIDEYHTICLFFRMSNNNSNRGVSREVQGADTSATPQSALGPTTGDYLELQWMEHQNIFSKAIGQLRNKASHSILFFFLALEAKKFLIHILFFKVRYSPPSKHI